MGDENRKDNLGQIVPADSQALSNKPTSFIRRGLRSLSGWDAVAIIELGKVLTSSRYTDEIFHIIHEKIDELLHPDAWSLMLVDEAKQELYFEPTVEKGAKVLKDARIKIGEGVAGWVVQHNEAVIVPDVSRDTRFFSAVDERTKIGIGSFVAVPMRHRDRCIGVIELNYGIGRESLSKADVSLLEALAEFAAIAIENANYVRRLNIETLKSNHYEARNFIIDAEIYRSELHDYQFSIISIDLKPLSDVTESINDSDVRGAFDSCASWIKMIQENFEFKVLGDLDGPNSVFWLGQTECIVLLRQTPKDAACNFALQLFRHWMINDTSDGEELANWKTAQESFGIRMGVATFPDDARTREDLVQMAYKALNTVMNSGTEGVAAANVGLLDLCPL